MAKFFKLGALLSRLPWLDRIWRDGLSWIYCHGIAFFDRSYRIVKFVSPGAAVLLQEGETRRPVMYALFHGRMVGLLGLRPRYRLTILISESRDGELISRGATGLGFSTARGSPARGAVKGAKGMLSAVGKDQDLAFMVDGPRGPRYAVKLGALRLAALAGTPIIPFVCSARSTWWMPTWDLFLAPWWSTPIVYILGEPLFVPPDLSEAELNELREQLELYMNHLRQCADNFFSLRS